MKKLIVASMLIATGSLLSSAHAAVLLTGSNVVSVLNTQFDLGSFPRADINSLPIVSSQQGGSYRVNAGVNGVGTVASGTAAAPSFSLTITNNTGSTLNSILLSGTVFQLKGNTGGIDEVLTASVSGIDLADPTVLDLHTVVDANGINNPPATAPFSAQLSGFSLANGDSITITWTDANDGGTDAFFGLGSVSVQAVPEPASIALLGLGGALVFLHLRRRQA